MSENAAKLTDLRIMTLAETAQIEDVEAYILAFARAIEAEVCAALAAPEPGGRKTYAAVGLVELVDALERADRKGYLPDAMRDAWDAFEYSDSLALTGALTTSKGMG